MLTEYFFIIDFDWISGAMSLNFIQCGSISYTIFIGCLTVRFDLSDYRLTAHVTYGIQCLCSFVMWTSVDDTKRVSAMSGKIRSRYKPVFNIFVSEFSLFLSHDYSTYSSLRAYVITNSYNVTWIAHMTSYFSEQKITAFRTLDKQDIRRNGEPIHIENISMAHIHY